MNNYFSINQIQTQGLNSLIQDISTQTAKMSGRIWTSSKELTKLDRKINTLINQITTQTVKSNDLISIRDLATKLPQVLPKESSGIIGFIKSIFTRTVVKDATTQLKVTINLLNSQLSNHQIKDIENFLTETPTDRTSSISIMGPPQNRESTSSIDSDDEIEPALDSLLAQNLDTEENFDNEISTARHSSPSVMNQRQNSESRSSMDSDDEIDLATALTPREESVEKAIYFVNLIKTNDTDMVTLAINEINELKPENLSDLLKALPQIPEKEAVNYIIEHLSSSLPKEALSDDEVFLKIHSLVNFLTQNPSISRVPLITGFEEAITEDKQAGNELSKFWNNAQLQLNERLHSDPKGFPDSHIDSSTSLSFSENPSNSTFIESDLEEQRFSGSTTSELNSINEPDSSLSVTQTTDTGPSPLETFQSFVGEKNSYITKILEGFMGEIQLKKSSISEDGTKLTLKTNSKGTESVDSKKTDGKYKKFIDEIVSQQSFLLRPKFNLGLTAAGYPKTKVPSDLFMQKKENIPEKTTTLTFPFSDRSILAWGWGVTKITYPTDPQKTNTVTITIGIPDPDNLGDYLGFKELNINLNSSTLPSTQKS